MDKIKWYIAKDKREQDSITYGVLATAMLVGVGIVFCFILILLANI